MNSRPVIMWFRQDLRLADNPALQATFEAATPVIPVFILDTRTQGGWAPGAASRWWLHQSLTALNNSLDGHLYFFMGDPAKILTDIANKTQAAAIYANHCYEPQNRETGVRLAKSLPRTCALTLFHGGLLYTPEQTLKEDGTPYKVFTPFYRKACLEKNGLPPKPLPVRKITGFAEAPPGSLTLDELPLLPEGFRWDKKLTAYWQAGEKGAQQALTAFLDRGLKGYAANRDHPDLDTTSRLSPYFHFGEISPRDVWHSVQARAYAAGLEEDADKFCSELGWREFCANLLYHFPELPDEPLQKKFAAFPWRKDRDALIRWQKGLTGYPFVDAGMRELWETGFMHNRVRMVVASFLVKHLLLPWKDGEKWFWDCLVDADLANNSANWQWVAGCGADAAPYFRIFNPVTQGQKFDPDGVYVRKWIKELAVCPTRYIHEPWKAPAEIRKSFDYPPPIVDHYQARKKALAAFDQVKG